MLQALGWRSLQERRFIMRLAMFHKVVNQQTAVVFPPYIMPSTRPTRVSHELQYTLPHTNLDLYKYSYFPRTIRAWNILPAHIAGASSTEALKAALLKEFTNGTIYMIPPRDRAQAPRLGSSYSVGAVGPMY